MVEEAKYAVVRTVGGIELRRYDPMVLASVPGLPDGEAFGILFRYIAGNNRSRQEIAMTAPVVSSAGTERIAMTAPVLSGPGGFAFVLPASYTIETAPRPLDPRIRLVAMGARLVAVVRFRGHAWGAQVRRRTEALLAALREASLRTRGEPFLMRYNPPFTPGFLRRNEVGVEVEA